MLKQRAYFWYFELLLCKYQWNVKREKARRGILNISAYTNVKHIRYMFKYRIKQHLIVLMLDSVSTNKILVTKFVTVKVSYNLTLMQSLSTQWNQQLIRSVFSKLIECLDQNIRKQIDCKRPLNRIPNKWTECKIFKLKCGNIKLSKILKYNQVNLVLAVFASS